MNVEKLFNGIAIIVDNEITDDRSAIYKIKGLIESKNIPVAAFTDVPQPEMIPAFASASFIILDWDYTNGALDVGEDERVAIPGALTESDEDRLISFIRKLISDIFVPVFIFTAKPPETAIERLKQEGLWDDEKPARIFVKQKIEVDTEEELFSSIEEWVKKMPSVYVLKEWESAVRKAQNAMFNELYSYSPNWTKIIWDMLKEDSIDNQWEFGNYVTRNLINRIKGYSFEERFVQSGVEIRPDELKKVVEGERYLAYDSQPDMAYTGDLFKDGSRYYLNIRAQCSISREDARGNYNPKLYCIEGKKLRNQDIVTEDIHLTMEEQLVFGAGKRFSLDEMREICKNETEIVDFNRNFSKHRNSIFFRKGTILERDDKVIVGCVAGEQAIKFGMDLVIREFEELKDKRIGRILPPYITKIQQKCAANMVREGVTPLPRELFMAFDE